MAAFGDEKMEGFTDRPWNSLPENLYDYDLRKATGATTEDPATQQESSSMKLKKEDMMLYGLCPAQDEFFLAICERCKLLVKPQALKKHIAIRHSNTEINNSKTSLSKTNDHTIRQNSHSQPEQFKNPRDYLGTKSQSVVSSRCHTSKHSGRRSNVLGKHSVSSDSSFSKNSKAPATTKNCTSKNEPKLSVEASRPTLMERITEGSERMSSILRSKPYVDIARIDSDIMSLISAMDESNSENGKVSDSIDVNDGQPPKLEPVMMLAKETKSEVLSRSEPQKISLNLLDQKVLPQHHVVLANTLAKTLKSSAPFLLSSKNGKLSSSSNENSQHSDSSSEVKGLPQPLIQLNLQNLRPLLSKTVIGHSSILAIKKAQMSTINHLQPNLKQTSSPSQLPPLPSSSSILVQKATSLSPSITLTSPKPHLVLAQNKSSPATSGKSSKKKGGNPDHALCKNRQYDPDKHCGVLIAETQKPCTRFLTCKTHPLLQRRSVHGRSKPFDELVREQREKRQALVRADSEGKEHKLLPGTSILKVGSLSRSNAVGSKANPMRSLFAANKKGPTLVATCPNVVLPQKPNHLPLSASILTAPGDADSMLKILPDQSPSEDVFSGLLSPSGMLLSPCGAGTSLFSPEPSGNLESFTKLKTEALDEMDFDFQTPDGSMPSLVPFEMKEEDMAWQNEGKIGISPASGEMLTQIDIKRLIKREPFGEHDENCSDECVEDHKEFYDENDDDFSLAKNELGMASHHPRPIAANHFNSWLHGDGNYVFTRRGETCRAALMTAVRPEARLPEPPRKRPRLDSNTSKPPSNISSTSVNLSEDQASCNRHHDAPQKFISSIFTSIKTPPTDLVHLSPPSATTEVPSQLRKRLESRSSFQCPLLPPNVTLTRSGIIPTPKSSSSLLISTPAKKQISLTPLNISQIAASLKGASVCGQVSLAVTSTATTAIASAKGSHLVHLTLPTSAVGGGLARTLLAISASPGTTAALSSSAMTASKTLAQSIAISKGATLLLQQPTACQHSVLSSTVILAPSKGANQSNLFTIQNSPETLLHLLPRGSVQNGRVAKKPTSVILANKGKAGTVDLSSVVGLGLRPPNIFLSTSGAGASSSSTSTSYPSVVGLNLPTSVVSKNSGQIQNLVLRLPNGIVDGNKSVIGQDSVVRVSSTSSSSSSSSSSVMVVTSLPDRPINSVLLINNKRLALSSTATGAVHPSHQSINLSSVLANQRQASSQSSSSSNSGLLLWGINSSNGTGSTNVVTLQQQQNQQPQQRLQRVQLVSNQSAAIAGNTPSNHVKESSAAQLTRINGISPRNTHILLGIPQKRQSPFPAKSQLVLGDLDDLGDLQAEEEILTQSTFPSPHRVILKGGSTSNLL